MATIVITDAKITINSINLSAWCKEASIQYEAETQDATAMTYATRTNLPGLKNWSMDVTFMQDYAVGSVDATLFSLVGAAAFPITLKASSAANSTTNPEFQGNAILKSYDVIKGKVGDLHVVTAKFVPGGSSPNLVRAVV